MTQSLHTSPTWTSDHPLARSVRLVRLPTASVEALARGYLRAARAATDLALTGFLTSDGCRSVWARRSRQIADDSAEADWVTRVVVTASGAVVGRAGFHGAPDPTGMVEVGYEIDPMFRRQGYARAALLILLDVARAEPGVQVLRATVSPDNHASRNLVEQHSLVETGEQWDDEDGLETIFEISV
ncbi:Acetyltransferase (GNAT) domain-containing protein [Sanguibacter gelidistatuariae]|uniref:Acetyltransferase (GNAT) domain-containing protein n=1 Tax=Sanguibacter gelidistatuariae TaxID=1814289 RepID=A0A1G6JM45_9MICO|nr:GNAT family N-acetyltransferase [Sanguibacter gelidistatuariae]SDC19036.1 Acetyltransferase (GNAT) domain-containing protein [Sanguibacter gelidistatuariae]